VRRKLDLADLRTNEYLVVAYTTIEPFAETDENRKVLDIFSVFTEDIRVKIMVEKYEEARHRALAAALRIRNYAAYFTRSQHPLLFNMLGTRDEVVNNTFLPMPMVFEGGTHLPFTDGGLGSESVFTTRFGPVEGLKPKYDEFKTKENVLRWLKDLNSRLKLTNKMLGSINDGSPCDAAINCLGESFWLGEATARFVACWRAIDTVAMFDHKVKRVGFNQIRDSVRKRSKSELTDERLISLRELRHVASHSFPHPEKYGQFHTRLSEVYRLARELTDSII
jgi:hypothetical protein